MDEKKKSEIKAMKYLDQYIKTGRKEYHAMAVKHFLRSFDLEKEVPSTNAGGGSQ